MELTLAALHNMAMSMPEFSEKFLLNNGLPLLLELMATRHEEILVNTIRLLYTLVEFSENNTKKILEEGSKKFEAVLLLQTVISGSGICAVEYSIRPTYYAIITLKKFIQHAPEISFIVTRKTLSQLQRMVSPDCLSSTPEKVELEIYMFLACLAIYDSNLKVIIGQLCFYKVIRQRLVQNCAFFALSQARRTIIDWN